MSLSGLFPDQNIVPVTSSNDDIQNILILTAAVGYFIFEKRPRGYAQLDLLDVKKSTISTASLGLFAKVFIPKGTILGSYPGVITSVDAALKTSKFFTIYILLLSISK
jgi:hypothetical protein